jgi:apolipoprotein D and lipocalin family protein
MGNRRGGKYDESAGWGRVCIEASMWRFGMREWVWGCAVAGMLGIAAQVGAAQRVKPVAKVDLNAITGTWFEMARLPDKAEKHCAGDAMMIFALGDKKGRFQVVESCERKDGTKEVNNASGRMSKFADGRLKVSHLWPFSDKRWVLAMGAGQEWVLLGNPNRKELWVLSKTETMTPEVLAQVEGMAAGMGFDVGKMTKVAQGV